MRLAMPAAILALSLAAVAAADVVGFESDHWDLAGARVAEHLGRQALMGSATLRDVEFSDGVIEFDVAVTGARSYPGVTFRTQPDGSWERFYIRPHRAGSVPPPLYPDVLQYVPAFHRVDSWQLYNGEGCTAPATIPREQWFHVRIEVAGSQARVFVGDSTREALTIHHLAHGRRAGGIGLMGPADGSAWFSDFSWRPDTSLRLDPPPFTDAAPGILREWRVSRPFPALSLDLEKTPEQQGLGDPGWQVLTAAPDGLVDIARLHPRSGTPDAVFARTILRAERERTFKLNLGYSDIVSVFLNGRLVFTGDSRYMGRDPSFLGIVGFFDTILLPLRKGENELLLAVAEVSGGWGFKAQDGEAVRTAPGVTHLWETPRALSLPETPAYDPRTRAIYVSNADAYNPSRDEARQFVSRLRLDGTIDSLRWVTGLRNPNGLAVQGERLWVAEPGAIVEVDIAGARIVARHDVPGARLLNGIAVGPGGEVYASDSRRGVIVRLAGGRVEDWLDGPEVQAPNGLCVRGGELLVVTMGDGRLKAVDLASRRVRALARFAAGSIDGVKVDGDGSVLVSLLDGHVYRVAPSGEVSTLIDFSAVGTPTSGFDIVPETHTLVICTWTGNRVLAYRLPAGRR